MAKAINEVMGGDRVSLRLDGQQELFAALAGLKQSLRNKHMRRAITKACRLLAKQAKTMAPKETGLLKKSIGFVVKTKGDRVVGIVGPRKGFKQPVVERTGGKRKSKMRLLSKKEMAAGKTSETYRDPVKYSHLVEYGHKKVRGGKSVGTVKPYPFMRPAFDSQKSAMQQIVREELAKGIEEEARKARKK